MADDIDLTAAIDAAARAIGRYDWDAGLSGNDVPGEHQRAESEAAVRAAAPLLIEQITQQVRAECWDDCTDANPCGYCQHGYRRALDDILSHDDGGHDWSIPDVVLLARSGEEAVDRANGGSRG